MKKLILMFGMLLGISATAFAQKGQPTDSYNRVYVSFQPQLYTNVDVDGEAMFDTPTGFSVGYLHGFSVSNQVPIFVEVGGRLNYAFGDNDYTFPSLNSSFSFKDKFLNLTVPVNFAYRYTFSNGMSISPYVGLTFKLNLIAKKKIETNVAGHSSEYTVNLFKDKDDNSEASELLEESGYDWKRFQVGSQVGFGFNWKALYVGVHYGVDFGKIAKGIGGDVSTSNYGVTVGYTF